MASHQSPVAPLSHGRGGNHTLAAPREWAPDAGDVDNNEIGLPKWLVLILLPLWQQVSDKARKWPIS